MINVSTGKLGFMKNGATGKLKALSGKFYLKKKKL